jgi:hypothetical protein
VTRTYRIPRSTVVAVGAYSGVWVGFVIVGSLQKTPGSLVFLPDNFDDLLSRLLELNPAIELRGWVRQEHDATALP